MSKSVWNNKHQEKKRFWEWKGNFIEMLVTRKVSYNAMSAVFSHSIYWTILQKIKNYAGTIYQNLILFAKLSNYQLAIRIKIPLELRSLTLYTSSRGHTSTLTHVKNHFAFMYLSQIIASTELEFTSLREEVPSNVFEFRHFRIQYQQRKHGWYKIHLNSNGP